MCNDKTSDDARVKSIGEFVPASALEKHTGQWLMINVLFILIRLIEAFRGKSMDT